MAKTLTDFERAQKHRYCVEPGGETVPGVTTIIDVLDKPGLKWAASGIAAESAITNGRKKKGIVAKHRVWLGDAKGRTPSAEAKRQLAAHGSDNEIYAHWARGEFDRQWRAKANRGTRVHDVAERWSRGETVDVLDEDSGFVDALERFHKLFKPKFLLVECFLINPEERYGGRTDAVVELDGPMAQGVFLADYKTGKAFSFDAALQAEGYSRCGLSQFNTDGSLIGSAPLPHVDGYRTIYLDGEGNVTVVDPFEKVRHDDAWALFKACRQVYEMSRIINASLDQEDSND